MKTLSTEIVIDANIGRVWKVLSDFPSYPEWNPFITRIQGNLTTGEKLDVTLKIDGRDPMSFRPILVSVFPEEKFCWRGKLFFRGLFDGTHYFILEKTEDGKTRLTQGENFHGLLSGPILRQIETPTLEAFQRMNKALKEKVEN